LKFVKVLVKLLNQRGSNEREQFSRWSPKLNVEHNLFLAKGLKRSRNRRNCEFKLSGVVEECLQGIRSFN